MAFIITTSILFLLFHLMTSWVVEVIKAFVENCHGEEDEETSISFDCDSKHLQRAHFFGASSSPPSPLPPLNPGATDSHPPLPQVSQEADVSVTHPDDCSVPSQAQSVSLQASLPPLNLGSTHSHSSLPPINDDDDVDDSVESAFHFDYYFKSQAPSPVDPTTESADDSDRYLLPLDGLQVVVRPKIFTAPIIILSPPSPKNKRWGTKKKERRTKLSPSPSPSPPAPLQTLTPNYARVFPRRERKTIPRPIPQAPAPVNPTISTENSKNHGPDNRVLAEVVLRPTVSNAPVISITPPSPKKKQGTKTEKSINKLSTSPLQNLTPDYHRDFTRRTPTPTQEVVDKENLPPLAVVSTRNSSRRSREEQLKEYIPPCYLLAQRCIDIVHSRSARHAWVDEMLYGEPRKF